MDLEQFFEINLREWNGLRKLEDQADAKGHTAGQRAIEDLLRKNEAVFTDLSNSTILTR